MIYSELFLSPSFLPFKSYYAMCMRCIFRVFFTGKPLTHLWLVNANLLSCFQLNEELNKLHGKLKGTEAVLESKVDCIILTE